MLIQKCSLRLFRLPLASIAIGFSTLHAASLEITSAEFTALIPQFNGNWIWIGDSDYFDSSSGSLTNITGTNSVSRGTDPWQQIRSSNAYELRNQESLLLNFDYESAFGSYSFSTRSTAIISFSISSAHEFQFDFSQTATAGILWSSATIQGIGSTSFYRTLNTSPTGASDFGQLDPGAYRLYFDTAFQFIPYVTGSSAGSLSFKVFEKNIAPPQPVPEASSTLALLLVLPIALLLRRRRTASLARSRVLQAPL